MHYDVHKPEPHVLLFRRPLGTDPRTGKVMADAAPAGKENAAQKQPQPKQPSAAAKQSQP